MSLLERLAKIETQVDALVQSVQELKEKLDVMTPDVVSALDSTKSAHHRIDEFKRQARCLLDDRHEYNACWHLCECLDLGTREVMRMRDYTINTDMIVGAGLVIALLLSIGMGGSWELQTSLASGLTGYLGRSAVDQINRKEDVK